MDYEGSQFRGFEPDAERKLHSYLADVTPGFQDGAIEVEQIGGGLSNITLLVSCGDRQVVLRRPPHGDLPPSAHDMSREYRFYTSLRDTPVPVPTTIALCNDPTILGAPFYLMEKVDGMVADSAEDLSHLTPAQVTELSSNMVRKLAAIHDVNPDDVGLGDVAKRENYPARQLRRLRQYCDDLKSDAGSDMRTLVTRLQSHTPEYPAATIVHGDYRLGNLMLDHDNPQDVVAVFDWELGTLGDPLADVAYLTLFLSSKDRPYCHPTQSIADLPGFLGEEELMKLYAMKTGRSLESLAYYKALSYLKAAAMAEGHFARLKDVPASLLQEQRAKIDWALGIANQF